MLGWTILFSGLTAINALLAAALGPEAPCWAARYAGLVCGSLGLASLGGVIVGKAVRNSLR